MQEGKAMTTAQRLAWEILLPAVKIQAASANWEATADAVMEALPGAIDYAMRVATTFLAESAAYERTDSAVFDAANKN